jgi:hypothetical protein
MNILVKLRNWLWPKPYPLTQSNYQSPSINDKSIHDKSMDDVDNLINEMLDMLNRIDYLKYQLRDKIENGNGNGAK